jgi:predicted nucleic acid-binding protein
MRPTDDLVILDACTLINLVAAGLFPDVSTSLGRPAAIVEQAAAESLYLHEERDGERIKVPIDVSSLPRLELTTAELDSYITLAQRLDDGEAASLAVAHHRRLAFATDDRAAIKAVRTQSLDVRLLSSAGLIRTSVDRLGLDPTEIASRLRRVEHVASFFPASDDLDREWWRSSRAQLFDSG